MSLSLGIDIGTSGVRSVVVDQDFQQHAMARVGYSTQQAEFTDAELWWKTVLNCLRILNLELQVAGLNFQDIQYITVAGTSGSMVLTDADLRPVSPAAMYNSKGFDAEASRIAEYVKGPHITRGGNSALARALHLINQAPDAMHLLHQADYIAAKLTGIGGQSDVMNALKTGVDPISGKWPEWILEILPPRLLPKAYQIGTPIGELVQKDVVSMGYSETATIHAGTTDSIAAFLAAAPLEKGVAVTSLGSTLAIKMLSDTRIDDPDAGLYAHRVANYWLVGGASNTGGRVLLEFFTPSEIVGLSQKIDTDVMTNLNYYPLLTPGERFPINDPEFAPRLEPRPREKRIFLQAILEGIARIEAKCYEMISAKGAGKPHRIMSIGGGASNPAFSALRAKALGRIPVCAAHSEAAFGAAKIPFLFCNKTVV